MDPGPEFRSEAGKIRWAKVFYYYHHLLFFGLFNLIVFMTDRTSSMKWFVVTLGAILFLVLRFRPNEKELLRIYNQWHKPISKWWIVVSIAVFALVLWLTVIRRNWH